VLNSSGMEFIPLCIECGCIMEFSTNEKAPFHLCLVCVNPKCSRFEQNHILIENIVGKFGIRENVAGNGLIIPDRVNFNYILSMLKPNAKVLKMRVI
jgi:hypothetical protein